MFFSSSKIKNKRKKLKTKTWKIKIKKCNQEKEKKNHKRVERNKLFGWKEGKKLQMEKENITQTAEK